jgi:hypothetical protein
VNSSVKTTVSQHVTFFAEFHCVRRSLSSELKEQRGEAPCFILAQFGLQTKVFTREKQILRVKEPDGLLSG